MFLSCVERGTKKASESRIRSSEVWFLVKTQKFSLSQACEKAENNFFLFFIKLKTNHLSYSISIELADQWEHTEATKPYALVSGFT